MNPPHLTSGSVPVTYPATPAAFRTPESQAPILLISRTRLSTSAILVMWIGFIIGALLLFAAFYEHSVLFNTYVLGAYLVIIYIGFAFTIGDFLKQPKYGVVPAIWSRNINSLLSYSPILAFPNGAYLRTKYSDKDFVYLPWTCITAIELQNTPQSQMTITVTDAASALLSPDQQQTHVINVFLNGQLLNEFAQDTPEKVAKSMQDLLASSRTSTTSTAAESPQMLKDGKKFSYVMYGFIILLFILMAAYYVYTNYL